MEDGHVIGRSHRKVDPEEPGPEPRPRFCEDVAASIQVSRVSLVEGIALGDEREQGLRKAREARGLGAEEQAHTELRG